MKHLTSYIAMLMLAGCSAPVTNDKAAGDGSAANVNSLVSGGAVAAAAANDPDRLPTGFTLYPGANITGGMKPDGQSPGMTTFKVKASADEVMEHFKKQAEDRSMQFTSETAAGNVRMVTAAPADGEGQTVTMVAANSKGSVNGTITFSAQ